MPKTKKTALIVILVSLLLVLAAGIILFTNQLLIARVLEAGDGYVLAEVCNPDEFRWLDRLSGAQRLEYVRLYTDEAAGLSRGQFFAAVTRSGQEDSDPPGIGARRIFK